VALGLTDLRYALRSLARSPGFVAIAVLALGVGLGLSTTMFGVLDAVLHPYVAFREPERLFTVTAWFGPRTPMTRVDLYRLVRERTHAFDAVVPFQWDNPTLERAGENVQLGVRRVSPRYFAATGLTPRLGRVFNDADGEDAIVLSHDLWVSLFGGRRNVGGAVLTINGHATSVVGVMPRGAGRGEAWMPLPASVENGGAFGGYLGTLVRLRQGVTAGQAGAELKGLAGALTIQYRAQTAPFSLDLNPVVSRREEIQDIHKAMVGSALVVLLIACVNLAHLMLARGMAKRRELALRMALGAGRAAVVRQMFTECAVITVGGAALGALVAVWGANVLHNKMPREVSWIGMVQPQLSWRVFAVAALAAAVAAVLFGLLPAMRIALQVRLDEPLKDDSGTTTGRVRQRYSALVVAEVALALVLLMGGALLLRTVQQLSKEQFGFDTRTLYRTWIGTVLDRDSAAGALRRREALTTAASVPGVSEFATEGYRKAPGGALSAELSEDSSRTISMLSYLMVSPAYLRVLGLPVLRGRGFEPGDAGGRGAAVIDPIAAQRLYPNQEPVGKMIKLGAPAAQAPWVPIVGVVRSPSVLKESERFAPQPAVFVVGADAPNWQALLVRTASPDPRIPARMQSRLRELPGIRGVMVIPYDYERQADLASRGFLAKVFVGMGVVALGLAVLGLYGVLAYAVSRRMREFAVRVALGADPPMLRRMVLHDGLVMLLAGIGVGAFVALAAARLLDSVLIAVLPSDVVSLLLSEIVLIGVGLAAALAPARRASRANPMDILRAV
jgi:predicted permease